VYKQAASGRSLLLILTHGWPGSSLDYLDMKSARRLPAAEIEARVIDAVGSFLEDSANIAGYFSGLSIPGARMLTSAAAHRATALREGAEQEKAQLIGRIVSSVVVQSDALEIQISKGTLGAELQW
jgi:hypothetical protein